MSFSPDLSDVICGGGSMSFSSEPIVIVRPLPAGVCTMPEKQVEGQ